MSRTVKIIFAVIVLLLINFLSNYFFYRIDLTANKEFTLSQATNDILRQLDKKVKVKVYFSDNLPVDIDKGRSEFKDLLGEYASLSKGQLEYQFISPNSDTKLEEEAMKEGIQPVLINVRDKDQAKQLKAFMGAIVEIDSKKEIIPLIQPGVAMEYSLTTAIKKMTSLNRPKIGFIQGHGEAALQELAQVYEKLSVLCDVSSVYLNDTIDLSMYRALALVRPKDSIPPGDFVLLDRYLKNGGKLLIACDQMNVELQQGISSQLNTGVPAWLNEKGIDIENALVRDISCGSVQVQQQSGFFSFATPVHLPYLPVIKTFSDHLITKGLEMVILQFASPVIYKGKPNMKFTPLMYTSDQSGKQAMPVQIDIQHQWSNADFPDRQICLGGVLEGDFGAGNNDGRLVIFGDGDFPVGGQGRQVNDDNVSLLANSVDWLSDDTGLIELRTKSVTGRPIKEIDDATRNFYKYLNFLLPIGLALAYGLFRSTMNRKKRIRRMETRYA